MSKTLCAEVVAAESSWLDFRTQESLLRVEISNFLEKVLVDEVLFLMNE